MYAMKYNIKINWAQMIMQQMWHVRGSQSLLPYAIFITKILEHFGVSLVGETKVALNLRESKIDVEVVHKMGFSINPIDRRTYRHQIDRRLLLPHNHNLLFLTRLSFKLNLPEPTAQNRTYYSDCNAYWL
ncbi:hypothetical protein Lal_00042902 [Lupinus albus]|nr:hypothetical protein Lal_00042902 [Lupinus albus]